MRWAKTVLLFQAIVTLIIGIAFFTQLTKIGATEVSDLTSKLSNPNSTEEQVENTLERLRTRYTFASYILLIIGLSEAILILRLLS
jgi:hypothetical protein